MKHALDRAHKRLFSGCDNETMAISDAEAGRVVATGVRSATMVRVWLPPGTFELIEIAPDR